MPATSRLEDRFAVSRSLELCVQAVASSPADALYPSWGAVAASSELDAGDCVALFRDGLSVADTGLAANLSSMKLSFVSPVDRKTVLGSVTIPEIDLNFDEPPALYIEDSMGNKLTFVALENLSEDFE